MRCGGGHVLSMPAWWFLSWWEINYKEGCRAPSESLVQWITRPAEATPSSVVTPWGAAKDGGILDAVTYVVALFSESRFCGVVGALATIGHA
uniref:Uncharacterized protein n=1 Tax=Oryza glumipatula TaxID=40148 RepID=A0A0D9ZUT9_9ORYZ